jgi:hypothetical protein
LNLNFGQSTSVNIYGTSSTGSGYYGGSYYISSNSNSTVATASISGNMINLYGGQTGSTTIAVCQSGYSSACANLYVTVGGYSYNTGGNLQYPGSTISNVLGANTYVSGQLIKEDGTVYIVYKGLKTGFASAYVFTTLGFKFSNVVDVGVSGLINSGYVISSVYASHPWGSWIKSGSTVYFVHESGLIPVSNYNTFISNGGQTAWLANANSADFRLPVLSVMVVGDSRLQ